MSTLISISNSSTLIGIGSDQPETVRAPEIEPGVGCDFDSYLLVPDNSLDERIGSAKARLGKDVVVLGHHYQRDEVVKFADFRGDSLKLSFQAAQTDARYVVFCGVHFMAESADILRRSHQSVILPDLNAGCSIADMADIGQVEVCWEELSRRAWRLGLHELQCRRGDTLGLRARRESPFSAGRAPRTEHRFSHGHPAGPDDRVGSLSGFWRQFAGSDSQGAGHFVEGLLLGPSALPAAAHRARPPDASGHPSYCAPGVQVRSGAGR